MRRWIVLTISLLTLALTLGATAPDESVILTAVEDTYVVADVSKTEDPEKLREQNFGGLDFIKVWYAFQVKAEEQVVSLGMFKFDLSPIKDKDIRSAHLQLFALRTDLAQPARLVDVSLIEGPWSEPEASFNNLPSVSASPLATVAVYGANVWYSWDVTSGVVRRAEDGTASFVAGLRNLENKKEEQVVFASREVARTAPRLVVTYPAAAPALPVYAIGGAAAGAAVIAFVGGILMGRRGRGGAGQVAGQASTAAAGSAARARAAEADRRGGAQPAGAPSGVDQDGAVRSIEGDEASARRS